jgi:hypothetical protein
MKYEIANELNIPTNLIQGDYWGNLSSRDCGAVGGNMVRRMIQAAEQSLIANTTAGVRLGFQQAVSPLLGAGLHGQQLQQQQFQQPLQQQQFQQPLGGQQFQQQPVSGVGIPGTTV